MCTKSKRIIIIAYSYSEGAAHINRLLAYAKSFSSYGHKVILVLCCTSSKEQISAIESQEFEIVSLWKQMPKIIQNKKVLSKLWLYRTLYKFLKKNDTVFIYDSVLVLSYVLLLKIENIFLERTEYPLLKLNTFRKIVNDIYLYMLKKINGLFVISESLKKYYVKNGLKENKIAIINMFVDSTRFDNISKNNSNQKFITYCGTISLKKDGVDILIKSFKLFNDYYPNYKLKLIGRFESLKTKNIINNIILSLGLKEKVIFTGIVSPSSIPFLLKESEMLVLSRPNNEQAKYGFPTKLGEYLSVGRPVVVTKVGELSYFLKDEFNCIFASPNDPVDFSNKLRWVVENKKKAEIIAKNGYTTVQENFSYMIESKKVLDFMKLKDCP